MENISVQNCNCTNELERKSLIRGSGRERGTKMGVILGWSGSKGLSGPGNTESRH
jgi:hypothetical protein